MLRHKKLLLNSLFPILFFFHILGIETFYSHRSIAKAQLSYYVWKLPKYIMSVLLALMLLAQLFMLVMLPDKKTEGALFSNLILLCGMHMSMFKLGNKIRKIIKKTSHIYEMLLYEDDFRKVKYFLAFVLIWFYSCWVWGFCVLYFNSEDMAATGILAANYTSIKLPSLNMLADYCYMIRYFLVICIAKCVRRFFPRSDSLLQFDVQVTRFAISRTVSASSNRKWKEILREFTGSLWGYYRSSVLYE